ncbi:PAS domain-containing protein [Marichromatium gracile]|uniref:chemotaxis protein CheB n=1 Tax=Marichromatium gracile TaxID=1048 RepID=UPI001F2E3998|nr:chemotaxis protein CheB [Marichromatium gracile]MCF1183207.1 PAS domain-containing protein [Marichromatium gracile]
MSRVSETTQDTPGPRDNDRYDGYVVAIGASAGGLDALERFFQCLPSDSGAAYVVIQHLSPDHKSMMGNLLARHTEMPVVTVTDGMRLEPNRVHLIPPANMMTVLGDALRLSPKNPRGLALPIDLFFTSLAKEFGRHAIGVVLSGTGSDGTRGAVAINDAGGLLLAQDPESAKFDGMPRSVIATGLVDATLSPDDLGPRLIEFINQAPQIKTETSPQGPTFDKDDALDEAMHLLKHQGGINFRDYKPATVMRRIERRMQVRHTPDLHNYVRLLDSDRGELAVLRRELLIPVTSFFRDPDTFEILDQTVIRSIVSERGENQPIRVWVPGVSTGEEAYTLAILFAEAFDRERRWPSFKLFATDVEQQNVEVGGAGVFSEAIAAEISPERLERFFYKRGNHFVVKNEIRQNIVFARHNLLEDPPFTRMDLVSCRNLLIYFRTQAQERALRRIQYALSPGGYLLLGPSETLADLHTDFTAVNSRHKIYRVLRHVSLPLDTATPSRPPTSATGPRQYSPRSRYQSTDAAAIDAGQSILLRDYAPTTLLLNAHGELLHVFGEAARYLRIGEGSATLDIAKLLPQPLVSVAQALLYKCARSGTAMRSDQLGIELPSGERERLRMVVRPYDAPQSERHLLLSFESEPQEIMSRPGMETLDLDDETAQRVENLERELAATRESLQATIEELETANEELQATNEELMASNEELQSSNEELQSVNEELYTVNAENQEKIEILNRLNADLDGMAKAAAIATVFVDAELRLTRFTPEATTLFKIRNGDLGRPIDDFSNLLQYPDFIDELRRTIASGEMLQREIAAANGRIYLARVLPYAVRAGEARGAVSTFVDITSLHDIERLQAVLDSLPEQVAVLDPQGIITQINHSWREAARGAGDPSLSDTGPGAGYERALRLLGPDGEHPRGRDLRAGIRAVLEGDSAGVVVDFTSTDEGAPLLAIHISPIQHHHGGAVLARLDASEWRQGEDDD